MPNGNLLDLVPIAPSGEPSGQFGKRTRLLSVLRGLFRRFFQRLLVGLCASLAPFDE